MQSDVFLPWLGVRLLTGTNWMDCIFFTLGQNRLQLGPTSERFRRKRAAAQNHPYEGGKSLPFAIRVVFYTPLQFSAAPILICTVGAIQVHVFEIQLSVGLGGLCLALRPSWQEVQEAGMGPYSNLHVHLGNTASVDSGVEWSKGHETAYYLWGLWGATPLLLPSIWCRRAQSYKELGNQDEICSDASSSWLLYLACRTMWAERHRLLTAWRNEFIAHMSFTFGMVDIYTAKYSSRNLFCACQQIWLFLFHLNAPS